MRYRLFLAAWLVVVWVALWRDPSVGNVLGGVIVAIVTISLFPIPAQRDTLRIRPLPMLRFVFTVAWSVVKANAVVAWEVLTPTNQINEGVVAVDLTSPHPVVATLVSHAIILAPGTMVIDIDDETDGPSRMYVHVLHLRAVEDVRAEVLELERLAVAAVGVQFAEEEDAR